MKDSTGNIQDKDTNPRVQYEAGGLECPSKVQPKPSFLIHVQSNIQLTLLPDLPDHQYCPFDGDRICPADFVSEKKPHNIARILKPSHLSLSQLLSLGK